MPKIDVTIPNDLKEILRELSNNTGQSLSEIACDCIKLGVVDLLEAHNKREVYRSLLRKRLEIEKTVEQEPKSEEENLEKSDLKTSKKGATKAVPEKKTPQEESENQTTEE